MVTKEYKQIGCMDVDPSACCAFQVRTETEDELWKLTSEHGKFAHNLEAIPPELAAKLKAAVKTVKVEV